MKDRALNFTKKKFFNTPLLEINHPPQKNPATKKDFFGTDSTKSVIVMHTIVPLNLNP